MKFFPLHDAIQMTLVSRADLESEGLRLKTMSLIDRAMVMSNEHKFFSGEQCLRRGWDVDSGGLAKREKAGSLIYGYSMGRGSIWMLKPEIQIV